MKKKEKNYITILHAAKGLFEAKGIDNVTFLEIAEAAGVSRSTVFNYFAGINELLYALSSREILDLKVYCENSGLKGICLVRSLLTQLITDLAKYPFLMTRLMNETIVSRGVSPIRAIEAIVADNLYDLPPSSPLQGLDPEKATLLIMGLYYGLVNHYHVMDLAFMENQMLEDLKAGLDVLLGKTA